MPARPQQLLTDRWRWTLGTVAASAFLATGCARIEVAPIEVKPIHITMDINLKIDRSLDEFFSFQPPATGNPPSSTPAPGPAVVVPPPTTLPTRGVP